MRFVLFLLALTLVPMAGATTLHDFEAVHQGDVDQSWPFTITGADVGHAHQLVLRGLNTRSNLVTFSVVVCENDGREVWWMNGSRSIQDFPAIVPPALASQRTVDCGKHGTIDEGERKLAPGEYTMILRGRGAFQVTDKFLERGGNMSVNATLHAPADAWTLVPTQRYFVDVTGDVSVEQYDLANETRDWQAPASLLVEQGNPYVFTVHGAEGAKYSITLRPAGADAIARVPDVGLLGLVLVASVLCLGRRGRPDA